ncbi:MAG: right-handed parallel beta-helix repeat-containing protein, partial [Chloroflexi bacterium]|nr:right-handed parallel beta-helix repeat-containing protein [Chloroflexota bacterium]
GTPGVTMTSPNPGWAFDFYSNGDYGLWIESKGNISITGLDATNNGSFGALLDNWWDGATGTVTITGPATGDNSFNDNWGDGLIIYSTRAITVSKLSAYSNGVDCSGDPCEYNGSEGFGVWLQNNDNALLAPGITINNFGNFGGNAQDGLWVTSYGVIAASNITANDNGQYNYWAEAQLPPEPLIDEGRGVYLNNCGFDYGLWQQDCTLAESPKAITLTGVNTFNGNFFEGLVAVSLGAINGNSVTANWNGSQGAYLGNQWGQPFAGGVVKLTGTNRFEGNDGDGLQVYSHGTITLNNVTSNWNTGDGTQLNNWSTTGPQVNVVLTGTNTFNGNGDWSFPDESWGLKVFSEGNITVNNLTANWNDYGGAYLNNTAYSDFTPLVTLTGANNFLGNQYDGLVINATGSVSLSKVTADGNGDDGVYVFSESGNVVISCGSMTSNGWTTSAGRGLYVQTATGTITLKGVYALGNWWNTQLISPFAPIIQRSC